jgi:hypothetical protein
MWTRPSSKISPHAAGGHFFRDVFEKFHFQNSWIQAAQNKQAPSASSDKRRAFLRGARRIPQKPIAPTSIHEGEHTLFQSKSAAFSTLAPPRWTRRFGTSQFDSLHGKLSMSGTEVQ